MIIDNTVTKTETQVIVSESKTISPWSFVFDVAMKLLLASLIISVIIPIVSGLVMLPVIGFIVYRKTLKLLQQQIINNDFLIKSSLYFFIFLILNFITLVGLIYVILGAYFMLLETNPGYGVLIIVLFPLFLIANNLLPTFILGIVMIFLQTAIFYFVIRWCILHYASGIPAMPLQSSNGVIIQKRYIISWTFFGLVVIILINVTGIVMYRTFHNEIGMFSTKISGTVKEKNEAKEDKKNEYNHLLESPEEVKELIVADDEGLKLLRAVSSSKQQNLSKITINGVANGSSAILPPELFRIGSVESIQINISIDDKLKRKSVDIKIPDELNSLKNLQKLKISINIPSNITNYQRNEVPPVTLEIPSLSRLTNLKEFSLVRGGNRELSQVYILGGLPNSINSIWIEGIKTYDDLQGSTNGEGSPMDLEVLFPQGNQKNMKLIRIKDSLFHPDELFERIRHYTSLESLQLINDNLTYLPDTIGDLTSLNELDISSNQIKWLPQSMEKISLQKFRAADTCIPFDSRGVVPAELKSLFLDDVLYYQSLAPKNSNGVNCR